MAEPGAFSARSSRASGRMWRLGSAAVDLTAGRTDPTSLASALARPGARFVMEVKKASPSAGAIRPGADPAAQAAAYAGAADAISVLTDEPFFGGSLEDLAHVRRVYDGPILAKDFIVDPRQVAEARLHGADAVLAMLSVLGDQEARAVMAAAERLGMDVLVEAHDEAEVARAVALGARIVGINNRDLRTLEVDLGVTERLAPLVPRDRLVVANGHRFARRRRAARALCRTFLVADPPDARGAAPEAARALAFGGSRCAA